MGQKGISLKAKSITNFPFPKKNSQETLKNTWILNVIRSRFQETLFKNIVAPTFHKKAQLKTESFKTCFQFITPMF